jgi:hypothetical protein
VFQNLNIEKQKGTTVADSNLQVANSDRVIKICELVLNYLFYLADYDSCANFGWIKFSYKKKSTGLYSVLRDPDPAGHFEADLVPTLHLMRIRILAPK